MLASVSGANDAFPPANLPHRIQRRRWRRQLLMLCALKAVAESQSDMSLHSTMADCPLASSDLRQACACDLRFRVAFAHRHSAPELSLHGRYRACFYVLRLDYMPDRQCCHREYLRRTPDKVLHDEV